MKTEPTIEQPEPAVRSSAWLADGIVIEAMRRWGGGFVKALAEAATRADSDNLRRIKAAWPEYWQEYSDMAKSANEKVSDGGPLTHELKQDATLEKLVQLEIVSNEMRLAFLNQKNLT